jgi:hypothetical protein
MTDMGEEKTTGGPAAAERLAAAIRAGDLTAIRDVLAEHPGLASAPLGARLGTRTALHVAADWPGYFPNGPQVVRLLVEAGADPDARCSGDETALHWAASSDDADVAEALIDAGADVDAPDGSIGTPLANAVGYCCWNVAALLVARGATVAEPWQAAALGQLDRLAELLGDAPAPDEVSKAFWHACSAAQRRAAECLLSRGADVGWVPPYAHGTPLDAATGAGTRRENVVAWLRDLGAPAVEPEPSETP